MVEDNHAMIFIKGLQQSPQIRMVEVPSAQDRNILAVALSDTSNILGPQILDSLDTVYIGLCFTTPLIFINFN
jgi:hypothetical protein